MIDKVAQTTVQCLSNVKCETGLPHVNANSDNVQNLLQLVFGIIGAIAVIVIMIAGLMLVSARGNPEEAAKARRAILFAAAGLAVAVSAEIIVTFVLGAF
jgi:hypothetical protein